MPGRPAFRPVPATRSARTLLVLVLGLLALVVPADPAAAHAYLTHSAPADGAVLDRAPELLTLSFTERVEPASTRITVTDGDGRLWMVGSVALRTPAGTAESDTESPVDLVAGLPPLPANTYHVSWQTLSSDDLHVTRGTLVFGVGRAVTPTASTAGPAAPGPRETAVRAIGLLGLALLLGGAGLALVQALTAHRRRLTGSPATGGASAAAGPGTLPATATATATATAATDTGPDPDLGPDGHVLRRRLLRIAAYGGLVALVATPLQLLVQLGAAGTTRRGLLVDQATSGRWLLRELGAAALLAAVLLAGRVLPTRLRTPVLLLGAVGAVATSVGTAQLGHPLGDSRSTALVGGLHVLAAGAWAGGVLVAALLLLPARRGERWGTRLGAVLHPFAVLGVCCLTVLAVTGLLATGVQVATVRALLTSAYGLLLLAKLVAVLVAGLLGLRTARRLRRVGVPPRGGLGAEAALLAGVLVLAGGLAAAGPARGPRFPVASAAAATGPEVTGQAADLLDTVSVRPNRPGRNIVSITVSDTRRPAPAPVTGVSVLLTGPDGLGALHPVTRTADGWVVPVDDIRSAGEWRLAVTVLRAGMPPVTDVHRWTVAEPGGVAVSPPAAPLRPVTDRLAVLVTVAVVLAGLLLGVRRLRRTLLPG